MESYASFKNIKKLNFSNMSIEMSLLSSEIPKKRAAPEIYTK